MTEAYEWGAFYRALGHTAPHYLESADPSLLEYVAYEAEATDNYWSEGLQATLDARWDAAPADAVRRALDVWLDNVRGHIGDLYAPSSLLPLPREERRAVQEQLPRLRLRVDPTLVDHLLDAALVGRVGLETGAVLSIQGVVTPYRRTDEGQLVRAVAEPWLRVLRMLQTRWKRAIQIPPGDWEALIAAAFDQAGFEEVTLTPRSGDFGRDVIAVRRGVGSVRIIGSVKAFAPDRRVGQDDVRALAGVLAGDHAATKGIITTTSDFAPGVRTDPFLAPMMPYRLELMNGAELRAWLGGLLLTATPGRAGTSGPSRVR